MTLHINEAEVSELLPMALALEAVEEISRRQAAGQTELHARRRIELPGGGFFHYMAAADFAAGYVATKQYTFAHGRLRFMVSLFEIKTGDMAALIEADFLGRLRTGAASGVATKYLARRDARIAAIIGTGGQARTQLEAVAAVRKLESVRAYGRKPERLEKFCTEMSAKLGIPVLAAATADEAVRGADIVCTATTAGHPVFQGAELSPGAHINAVGANFAHKRELDDAAIARVNRFVVDSVEQSGQEAGDLIVPFGRDEARWAQVVELHEVVAGKARGRTSDSEITLFKSNGIALWDLAVALRVYTLAREQGKGRELPLWAEEKEEKR
jgi:alanine dehydrogenase